MQGKMPVFTAKGLTLPVLGQGGWHLGNDPSKEADEIAALRRGLELGMTLIDTAEMYGDGRSEILIGKALNGIPRSDYLLTSKVLPYNAGRKNIFKSCEASLRRLNTDYLDLYLLHWPGSVPLAETVECMEELVSQGKIRHWGVSNFDTPDMEKLWKVPGGSNCVANQVLYHLGSRGIEFDLILWLRERNVAVMAYCPLAQGGTLTRMNRDFLSNKSLLSISAKYDITIMQLLLAFVLKQDGLIAIPKSGRVQHVEQNAESANICISDEDWAEIDRIFWPPTCKMHLDIE